MTVPQHIIAPLTMLAPVSNVDFNNQTLFIRATYPAHAKFAARGSRRLTCFFGAAKT
jgi:hypothetical protein